MQTIIKDFPLPRIQCGAMLGNGLLGANLWGHDQTLNMTLGCANLWDHRGGLTLTEKQNFKAIRQALEQHDQARITEIFASERQGTVSHPCLLSLGRVVITLPADCTLLRYEQDLQAGLTHIVYGSPAGEKKLDFCADMSCHCGFSLRGLEDAIQVKLQSAWELMDANPFKDAHRNQDLSLQGRGFQPSQCFTEDQVQGFIQPRPNDPSVGVLLVRRGGEAAIAYSGDVQNQAQLRQLPIQFFEELSQANQSWWDAYWQSVPQVSLDSADLEEIYWHGMYKFGIMTNPAGVTPGLQGPWLEDNCLPPWSGDYHFNINVQLCNAPALKAGRFQNLKPIFDLIFSWKDKLRHNAKCFAGIEDGYMLPHAVDDRGTCMGAFWTGNIDHACSAWMAQLMYDYCDYSGDLDYLRDHVYDFMHGVMNVFKAMLEPTADGKLALPVSISPEYRGAAMNAWGRNSSFQLAAIHNLANNLLKAARTLGVSPDPFWTDIQEKLPKYSLYVENGKPEIGMWDGLALEESHRHHSHLGAICPFDVLDPDDPELKELLNNSMFRWTMMGMGMWSGWCVPWASQIRTRMGHSEMAVLLLELWKKVYTNQGGGSLHDSPFPGFTVFASIRGEIMQMDGAMGAVAAIQDLLGYSQRGVIHVFRGIPKLWKNTSVKGLHLPGGFLMDGQFCKGRVTQLKITATRDQELKLALPGNQEIITRFLKAGESFTC